MSSALLPSRGQCIHFTDNVQQCQCPWFVSTLLEPVGSHPPVLTFSLVLISPSTSVVSVDTVFTFMPDYVSMVVSHYPASQCVAYVQNVSTPLSTLHDIYNSCKLDASDATLHV